MLWEANLESKVEIEKHKRKIDQENIFVLRRRFSAGSREKEINRTKKKAKGRPLGGSLLRKWREERKQDEIGRGRDGDREEGQDEGDNCRETSEEKKVISYFLLIPLSPLLLLLLMLLFLYFEVYFSMCLFLSLWFLFICSFSVDDFLSSLFILPSLLPFYFSVSLRGFVFPFLSFFILFSCFTLFIFACYSITFNIHPFPFLFDFLSTVLTQTSASVLSSVKISPR